MIGKRQWCASVAGALLVCCVARVGYFFAWQLHEDLKMPVGLVQSFWGGSRIEAWTSMEALQANPALRPVLDYWIRQLTTFDAARTEADTVVVQSDRVRRPVAVRFAWGNTDVPNLCNGEGFPASLFRTDASP